MKPVSPVLPSQPRWAELVIAKNQEEYQPLPVVICAPPECTFISCWQLTWRERLRVLWTGRFWFQQMTFGSKLQPQLPSVYEPQLRIE